MAAKHQKTQALIFDNLIRSDVNWADIIALLQYRGAEISEGKGSRVRIALNGISAVFDRPHQGKETDKGALKSMRRFLVEAGVKP
ncbi:MAG: type II toxin-antitoxin system HicA family toxin [Nitrospirae bacterium]|nr:MAG: type II toxin-antitoxin system HicA family toxin [Nitrospirota bacterium]